MFVHRELSCVAHHQVCWRCLSIQMANVETLSSVEVKLNNKLFHYFMAVWSAAPLFIYLFTYFSSLLLFPLSPYPQVCVCVCVTFIDAAVATTIMLSSSSQLLLLLLKIKMRMFVFGLSKCKLYVLWISTRHMFHLRNFSAGSLIKMDSICCWLKREMLRFSSLQFFGCCCFFTLFILVLDAVFQSRRPTPPTSSSYSYPSSIYLFGQQKPRKVHIFE